MLGRPQWQPAELPAESPSGAMQKRSFSISHFSIIV
eukprot:SAG11_NODE_35478_length_266_cov_0.922156_1_plen_35_part_01